MATEQELWGIRSLNGKVEAFGNDAIRTKAFSSKFEQGRSLLAEDGTFEWDELQYSRSLAPVTGHHDPAPIRQGLVKITRKSAVAHIKESKVIDAHKLYYQREAGSLRPNAQGVIEAEIKDLVNRIAATWEYLCCHTLLGTLTVNSTNIPGTTMPFTLIYSPNTYTASADWNIAGTGVLSSEVPAIKQDCEQTGGLPAAHVIVGSTVEGYILGNTQVSNFAQPLLGERMIEQAGVTHGPMLGGLRIGGLTWEVCEGGYVPDGGSFTRYLATTDAGIVLPPTEAYSSVLGYAQGRGMIPGEDIVSLERAKDCAYPAPQEGWYGYAVRTTNPPGVMIVVGRVGLPVLLFPSAVNVLNLVA